MTKPLMKEVFVQEEVNKRIQTQLDSKCTDFKKMVSILRLPRMTGMFQKAMWRHDNDETRKVLEKGAINHLRQIIDQTNESQFFDNFAMHINKSL